MRLQSLNQEYRPGKGTERLGEAGDMDMDFKIPAADFGEVGGNEREMDLWNAVSLSSKKSSSSASVRASPP